MNLCRSARTHSDTDMGDREVIPMSNTRLGHSALTRTSLADGMYTSNIYFELDHIIYNST